MATGKQMLRNEELGIKNEIKMANYMHQNANMFMAQESAPQWAGDCYQNRVQTKYVEKTKCHFKK